MDPVRLRDDDMKKELDKIKNAALKAAEKANGVDALQDVRVQFLGRKGELTKLLKGLKDLDGDARKEMGQAANAVKEDVEAALVARESALEKARFDAIAQEEWIDVTAPGTATQAGSLHLVTQTINKIVDIFASIGFSRVAAPEVDWDYYAFEALNMPKEHPARDDWETFFIHEPQGYTAGDEEVSQKYGKQVLTPHTSNAQVRLLEEHDVPLKVINIARVYRRQADASHVPMFHQVEGFCVGDAITIADLKGTVEYFLHSFFGQDRKIRYRPYDFRFTEPSFEIDIDCDVCGGTGHECRVCKGGWVELAGAGLTHPHVLKCGGVDPEKYSAFAFGFGVERIAMMKGVSIPDMRMLYQNDLRFLKQF